MLSATARPDNSGKSRYAGKKIILICYIFFFQYQHFSQNVVEDSLFNEARFYYYTLNFDSAENYIERIIELNPHYAKAYDLYGDTYRQKGQYAKALEMYKKGFSIDSTDLNMMRHIATVQIDLGHYITAIGILMDLIKKDDKVAEFYVDIGDATFKIGDTTKAIYYFSKAKALKSNLTLARVNLANMYLAKAQWQKGIDELLYVMMLDHWYPIQSIIQYCSIMAESEFKSWVEQQPNESEAYYYYSFSLLYKYGIDEALKEIEKAIKLNNQVEKYYLTEASMLYNKKEYEKVIEEVQKCLKIYPNSWGCTNILSKTLLKLGDVSAAIGTVKKSIEMDSSIFSSHLILGELYNKNKVVNSALENLNKALILRQNVYNPKLLFELALAHYYLRDYKKAWGYAKTANKIYSSQGAQTFLDEDISEEINSLITEIWKNMD